MWSDRKPQEDSPVATPAPNRSEAPLSQVPVGASERAAAADSRGIAVIGKGMMIKGQIRSAQHMHIAGEIEGSLHLAGYDLTATAGSKVRADVTAREVDIAGSIQGNVDATRKITVRNGGRLIGDLRTPGIVIEDGAYFKGNIEIVTREARQTEDDSAPKAARTASASA